jgi:D-glycero-alpha-D-manno-heptose-7-phosphate kinase
MIQCISPLRISFMGGRTDFPSFYHEEEGFVVSTTIDKYIHLSIDDGKGILLSQQGESEIVTDVEALKNNLVKEILKEYGAKNLAITATSDTPSGTGLGSSSSFTVALLRALHLKYKKQNLSAQQVAELASTIEIERLGSNTGKQDQYAAAFGGFNAFRFLPNGKVEVKKVKSDHLQKLESSICVFYTGISRDGSKILESERGSTSKQALQGMRDLAKVFYQEITTSADIQSLGEILHTGWLLKKGISNLISNDIIEDSYKKGLTAGAYGGKLLGAGGGGFLLFICPPEKQENLQKALQNLKPLAIKFSTEGAKIV